VRDSAGKTAVALLTAGICTLAAATPSGAQIAFTPCADSNDFACGHLTVPLDPSGTSPGTITLAVRRHRAPVGDEKSAVIVLAGGPGQAALPFAEQSVSELGGILATRDLIMFDQRGTGFSHPLSCHSFELSDANNPPGSAIRRCAEQIGPSRTFFTTADSVADIEAIRVAGGYEKLVLYGTSYGTKLAELYAQQHPGHVEALVLDSVVPPNGPDPLSRASFAAVPRVLGQLCAARACAHVTPSPTADLSNLIRRLEKRRRRARWIDGHGRGHTIGISSDSLVEILIQGDLEPSLRAEFPAAVRSAVDGDDAPLARLLARTRSSEEGENEGPPEGFDSPLYYATTCEEDLFPWSRAAAPAARLAEARAHIRALGQNAFAAFTPTDVMDLSDMPACAFWPFTTPAPTATQTSLPSVPALILSGADDLRTPTANAREVAAQIPGAKLLVVPNTGHSVLDSDPTGCSSSALQALFKAEPIKACTPTPPPFLLRPAPLPPARLTDIAPARGNRGRPGRTLAAVLLTLADFDRQLELQALGQFGSSSVGAPTSLNVGGLRSGWAEFTARRIVLHQYSYVPGVTLSGVITASTTSFSVAGRAAAHGRLRIGTRGTLTGFLDGNRVSVSAQGPSANGARAAADLRLAAAARAARRR
jgi:pimeloyl-ACP methyl ester carboxylesterase